MGKTLFGATALVPLAYFALCISDVRADEEPAVSTADAAKQIQQYLDVVEEHKKAAEKIYGNADYGISNEVWDKIQAAMTARFNKQSVSNEVSTSYAHSWAGWLASDYGAGAIHVYRYHERALQASLENIKSVQSVPKRSLDNLNAGLQDWIKYEEGFRTAADTALDQTAEKARLIDKERKAPVSEHAAVEKEFDKSDGAYSDSAKKLRSSDKHFFAAIQGLHVALAVSDVVLRAGVDPLIEQIQNIEKRIDDERHSLATLRDAYELAKREFDKTDEAFTLANNKKRISEQGVIYFARIAVSDDEKEIPTQIDWLKAKIAEYDAKNSEPDDYRRQLGDLLKYAEDRLARIRAGEHVVYVDTDHPKTALDQEMKRFMEAVDQLGKLDGPWREQLTKVSDLDGKLESGAKTLADDTRALSQLKTKLYSSAMTPSVQQIDVALAGVPVYSAVYDPAAACLNEQLKDIQSRIDNDKPYYTDILAAKTEAFQAFQTEGNAAVAVGKRLAGDSRIGIIFSDIMLSAYAQRGAEVAASVYDLVKAGKNAGPYGVLAEALKQETDFAIKFVASGGEDVGYTGIDEKAMEAAAKAQLDSAPPETWPEKMDRYQKKAVDKAVSWTKDKAETFIPDKLNAAALKGSLREAIVETGKAPILGGEGACKSIARTITGAVSSERARQDQLQRLKDSLHEVTKKNGTLDMRAAKFAKDKAEALVKSGLKAVVAGGANYLESKVWVEYFEHDLRARSLYVVWQRAASLWDQEVDYYNGLLAEQQQLLSQQKVSQLAYRESLNRAFDGSNDPREMSVVVKTAATTHLDVQIDQTSAKSSGAQFIGIAAPSQPDQKTVRVTVNSQPN